MSLQLVDDVLLVESALSFMSYVIALLPVGILRRVAVNSEFYFVSHCLSVSACKGNAFF